MYSGITPQAVEEHCSGLDWGGLRQTDLARDWDVGGSVDGFGDFSAQRISSSLWITFVGCALVQFFSRPAHASHFIKRTKEVHQHGPAQA